MNSGKYKYRYKTDEKTQKNHKNILDSLYLYIVVKALCSSHWNDMKQYKEPQTKYNKDTASFFDMETSHQQTFLFSDIWHS